MSRMVGTKLVRRVPDPAPLTTEPIVRSVDIVVVPDPVARPFTHARYHHLDVLRGLLMVLGVVLHASLIYSSKAAWLISDPERSPVFDAVFRVIHAFRMPAFFVIAGFLCVPSLHKGVGNYLRDRGRRLILPLVATALTLNALQTLLIVGADGFVVSYTSGRWVSHLWFLLDLIVFTVVAACVWAVIPRLSNWRPPLLGGAVILLLPLLSAGLRWGCDRFLGPDVMLGGFLNLNKMLYYLPFFLYGMLERPSEDPVRLRRLAIASAVLLLIVLIVPTYRLLGESLYRDAAIAWASSILCLYLGLKCLNLQIAAIRVLAEASYTIFLFHHLIVVAVGMMLIPTDLPIGVKFGIVVIAGFAISLAIHIYVIRPSALLSLIFNGRRTRSVQN